MSGLLDLPTFLSARSPYNLREDVPGGLFADAGLEIDLVQGLILGPRGGRPPGPLLTPRNRVVAGARWRRRRCHSLLIRGVRRTARQEEAR